MWPQANHCCARHCQPLQDLQRTCTQPFYTTIMISLSGSDVDFWQHAAASSSAASKVHCLAALGGYTVLARWLATPPSLAPCGDSRLLTSTSSSVAHGYA